jgi:hypothetical protein
MSAAPGTSWPTLAAFHAEDPAQAVSREVVFGSEWYSHPLVVGQPGRQVVRRWDTAGMPPSAVP